MKGKRIRRFTALFLALVLGSSAFSGMSLPAAANTTDDNATSAQAESSSSYEPWAHGYRFVDILNF